LSSYLDTHVAVWLYAGRLDRLSQPAKTEIDAQDLLLSPIVLMELEYLRQRKRVARGPVEVFQYLNATFGVGLCHYPFPAVALEGIGLNWTNDPFDRIIVAQAKANDNAPLITADAAIRRHYKRAVW
jgi:PIN domain nuclease of toxin-antitoxin system